MEQILKNLAGGGLFPTRMTNRDKVQSIIQMLHPVSCDRELIRLGPNGDGGYLVPDDLKGIEACFSPGVDVVSGFEKDCADRGMKVFLADGSVEKPAESHKEFYFTNKFVGATSDDVFMTCDDWVSLSLPRSNSDLMLQIDIEGYEYEVFLSISDNLMDRFRIIAAEFHYIDQFWSEPFFNLAARAFQKILQTHACVHIHPNNTGGSLTINGLNIPRVMEFTFLRKDRIIKSAYQNVFPNPLDCDNSRDHPSFPLPKCWYHEE